MCLFWLNRHLLLTSWLVFNHFPKPIQLLHLFYLFPGCSLMNAFTGPHGTINWQPVSDLVTSRPRATTPSYHLATKSFSPRTRLQTGLSSRLIGCLPKAARCLWTASSRSQPARPKAHRSLPSPRQLPLTFDVLSTSNSCQLSVDRFEPACPNARRLPLASISQPIFSRFL